jgi:hypothetical protein
MSDGKYLRQDDLETLSQMYEKDFYTTTIRK